MVMLPIQKARQKPLNILWSESFWVVPIIHRSGRATWRRLSIPAAARRDRRVLAVGKRTTAVINGARYAVRELPVRKRWRGRGDLRRELGCPPSSWGPLMAFTSLPLRCHTSPRLRLQYVFRNPGL